METLRSLIKSIPGVARMASRLRAVGRLIQNWPGHYYSPIPSMKQVRQNAERIFDRSNRELAGIQLNADAQIEMLERLAVFYPEQPFTEHPTDTARYFFQNRFFGHSDSLFLYSILRLMQPKRVIEIGSGFSSFVMLDTNDLFLGNQIQFTFIEPNDKRLRTRMKKTDFETVEICRCPLLDVPISRFEELSERDILFIDSSHVSKAGSDVNLIFFEILPRLKPGVLIHFHDMFYPFEYPEAWITSGRYWNEDYMMRAFLEFNSSFGIVVWNHFLGMHYPQELAAKMPLCLKNVGGSLWIERLKS